MEQHTPHHYFVGAAGTAIGFAGALISHISQWTPLIAFASALVGLVVACMTGYSVFLTNKIKRATLKKIQDSYGKNISKTDK